MGSRHEMHALCMQKSALRKSPVHIISHTFIDGLILRRIKRTGSLVELTMDR